MERALVRKYRKLYSYSLNWENKEEQGMIGQHKEKAEPAEWQRPF